MHAHAGAHTHTHLHAHTLTHTRTYTYTHIRTRTHTYTHTHLHAHARMCTHTRGLASWYTNGCIVKSHDKATGTLHFDPDVGCNQVSE